MSSAEIAEADAAAWIAVVPLGAIEQHGPHLPLVTDSLIGTALLALSFELMPDDLPVTAMPMIEIGKSDEHLTHPGTLTLSADAVAGMALAEAEGAIRAGVRKIVFVNAHGGNSALLDTVTRELRRRHGVLAAATSWSRLGVPEGVVAEEEVAFGVHGGQIETSLMLYLRPELVRMELAEDFASLQEELVRDHSHLRAYGNVQFGWLAEDLNPAGVVGNAAAATAEIGQAIAHHQAEGFARLCRELHAFAPPWFTGN